MPSTNWLDRHSSAHSILPADIISSPWMNKMPIRPHSSPISVYTNGWSSRWALCNSPATFQRCMDSVLKNLIGRTCLVYLDDIISFGTTFDETMHNLTLLFERLRDANLKLKPKKCHLFQHEVEYLGHVVSPEGIYTDPKKISAVRAWKTPQNLRDVRSFLGLASYYRKFIPRFSTVAYPLIRLTEKNVKFHWSDACQLAFDKLKVLLTTAPVLAYPKRRRTSTFWTLTPALPALEPC